MSVQIQNVVASAAFNQTFDLTAIANAFPRDTEFKGRFPGLVFKLKKPKTTMLIFKTGKMICTGGKGEDEARRAILGAVRKLRKGGINVAGKPEIKITNIVASAILNGVIDLDKLYSSEGMGGNILFEPEQFPALIYRWESPKVIFLVFSTGKIVCVGAKKKEDIYEAIENLRRKLEESEVLIRS
ncbi:MAG: TATA-box-binding protein [Candidatus Bathyarchaeota archaeon]|nr:TATA-box-binding protein [Candidatus Bathyarchaeota archaeon]MDH5419409.1 TATA-box-binding protein [Candidatus Bathyarchaeota archaeon]MDH5623724.1 TATA-box-binding protein [Candidatus Bathyarchaeota archaeon]MDH5701239.1 TATA-box-binding protein [Candidatus Bathyarchaeota archaeon]